MWPSVPYHLHPWQAAPCVCQPVSQRLRPIWALSILRAPPCRERSFSKLRHMMQSLAVGLSCWLLQDQTSARWLPLDRILRGLVQDTEEKMWQIHFHECNQFNMYQFREMVMLGLWLDCTSILSILWFKYRNTDWSGWSQNNLLVISKLPCLHFTTRSKNQNPKERNKNSLCVQVNHYKRCHSKVGWFVTFNVEFMNSYKPFMFHLAPIWAPNVCFNAAY